MTDLLDAALGVHEAGLCLIPARTDGSKAPVVHWSTYQHQRPTEEDIRRWFTGDRFDGFGVVCGTVSGNLEMLEFEGRAIAEGILTQYIELLEDHGLGDLWERITRGYSETTPKGGLHILVKVDGELRGNTKLARRPSTPDELAAWKADQQAGIDAEQDEAVRQRRQAALDKVTRGEQVPQVLIETRGEGGFVVIAPSSGRTHPSGKPWTLVAGDPATIATISEEERNALHAVATLLDAMPAVEPPAPAPPTRGAEPHTRGDDDVLRPGDDFNARADWADILEPHGWRHTHTYGRARGWTRPGKNIGPSATTGRNDGDNLYVFSSSTIFDTEKPYSKFTVYTQLEHGGNYASAARALRLQG
ncbi:bifunctional DNA primase/polymerase [Nonomuraea phyllanthi]|uniref:bifunctional DNA primase/polymerase n=1 Tax=Nonomuraea phyllanthi TaxID=2219224 RepID=UPI00186B2D37|nr:bifunctional DNA primase/polymerase [Nonomuraea phyllanthi]